MTNLEAKYKGAKGFSEEESQAARQLVLDVQNTFLASNSGKRALGYLLYRLGYFDDELPKDSTEKRNLAAELMKILSGYNSDAHTSALLTSLLQLRKEI